MGANLSSQEKYADTRNATLAAHDRDADIILGALWGGSLYAIGMIFCAVQLLARWSGKHGERGVNMFSVLAAFIVSVGWPLILIYLARSA